MITLRYFHCSHGYQKHGDIVSNKGLKIANRSAKLQTKHLILSATRDNCTRPMKVCSLPFESVKPCQRTRSHIARTKTMTLVQSIWLQSAIALTLLCDKRIFTVLGLKMYNEVAGKAVRAVRLNEAWYQHTFSVTGKKRGTSFFSCQGLILRYATLDLQR